MSTSPENNNRTESLSQSTHLELLRKIPEQRLETIAHLANMKNMDVDMITDCIGYLFEDLDTEQDPEKQAELQQKIKRVGEILRLLSRSDSFSEDVEKNDVPEKINELLDLVRN